MIAILVKEEDDVNKNRPRSIVVVTDQRDQPKPNSLKKGHGMKGYGVKSNWHNYGSPSTSNKKEFFNGKCNYNHKFSHKKVNCWKLKESQENAGNDKQNEVNQS